MSTERVLRLNELFRRELHQYLEKEFEPPRGCIVTIEELHVSGDLSSAKIFVSVYPVGFADSVLHKLEDASKTIRHDLAPRLNLRIMPALLFRLDEREERADHINRVLDQAEKEAGSAAKE